MNPADLKYTKDHEWVRLKDGFAEVGITDYAQSQLGDVVYVEMPEAGREFSQGEVFGTIESVKAVSELYAPASGQVIEANAALTDSPQTVNESPFDTWIIRLRLANPDELASLLDAEAYTALTKSAS